MPPAPPITLARVYGFAPAAGGSAVLLDRLWPRGIAKASLPGLRWEKDATPSTALRRWFHAAPDERFDTFCQRFRAELQAPAAQAALARIRALPAPLTLLTAARQPERSHLHVLAQLLRQG